MDIYVVVDDYDLVVVLLGNLLMVLFEYLLYVRDFGLYLVVVWCSGGVVWVLFELVFVSLCDLGCWVLLMSGCLDEGVLFGLSCLMLLLLGWGILVIGVGDE